VKELTTTSYVMLGLLAVKPWTAYELAKQMKRAVRMFWPRAERKLYEEPKNLVAHGLASSKKERVGRRPRTLYSITPKGRRAFKAWLDEAPSAPSHEFEGLAKAFFAEQGTKDQLLTNLRTTRVQAEAMLLHLRDLARENLETEGGPFPHRLHVNALAFAFQWRYAQAMLEWALWAEAEVRSWSRVSSTAEKLQSAMELFRDPASWEPVLPTEEIHSLHGRNE
jgi:PadR family transcriptional regulator AphA